MKKTYRIFPIILMLICGFSVQTYAQNRALLLIDIQQFYFPGGDLPLDNPEAAALNAGLILEQFRKDLELVIHVRHNYEPGGDIHEYVSPISHELIVGKDQVNVFLESGLDETLKENDVSRLVICGMQTHMCMEAAARAASDLGYEVTVIADACATRALQYGEAIVPADHVHQSTLATLKSYARIITTTDYLIEESK